MALRGSDVAMQIQGPVLRRIQQFLRPFYRRCVSIEGRPRGWLASTAGTLERRWCGSLCVVGGSDCFVVTQGGDGQARRVEDWRFPMTEVSPDDGDFTRIGVVISLNGMLR